MLNSVLLSGRLTEKRLCQATREIQNIASGFDRSFNLVIDSDGGDMKPTIEFVEFLWTLTGAYEKRSARKKLDPPVVKIYHAESAAAFIALAVKARKEMQKGSTLDLHRGALWIEATEIDLDSGKLNDDTLGRLKQYEAYLKQALGENELLSDSKAMADLYGSGWLRLSADECLKRGIVQELF